MERSTLVFYERQSQGVCQAMGTCLDCVHLNTKLGLLQYIILKHLA